MVASVERSEDDSEPAAQTIVEAIYALYQNESDGFLLEEKDDIIIFIVCPHYLVVEEPENPLKFTPSWQMKS